MRLILRLTGFFLRWDQQQSPSVQCECSSHLVTALEYRLLVTLQHGVFSPSLFSLLIWLHFLIMFQKILGGKNVHMDGNWCVKRHGVWSHRITFKLKLLSLPSAVWHWRNGCISESVQPHLYNGDNFIYLTEVFYGLHKITNKMDKMISRH